jgi:hypothetical protein
MWQEIGQLFIITTQSTGACMIFVNFGLIPAVYSFRTHQLGREKVKTKKLTAACMIIAMATGFASTSFAEGGGEVICNSECEEPPTKPKGNNGWGNGIDGDNAGTPKGGTAPTKLNEATWDKFSGR